MCAVRAAGLYIEAGRAGGAPARPSGSLSRRVCPECQGVRAAARQLNLHESQIYDWRAKARVSKTNGQLGQAQAVEIARLKRQLAEQAEELALLKKASAYFAKHLK